ncbi:uncharacterized protein N7518_002667 [Penicillium psychrosexuale]|uniref:uncharacterized protein n=1 Tax=Penicillium psychrosexuale TaxID=1002107 RepID=UPI002544F384|nr:uncharacterized protein N7518_002667 [Penicillium psychrosexuale]KAJ5800599.1 hypothetical protein N7518_002667 [Penicillium psychrosexuale]
MTARIDGCLVGTETPDIFAITEVKPALEAAESTEMVSWILHDEEQVRKTAINQCLLVSQDNHEIWLTIAKYNNEYVIPERRTPSPYATSPRPAQNPGSQEYFSFIRMQEYGPWKIRNRSHMQAWREYLVMILSGTKLKSN